VQSAIPSIERLLTTGHSGPASLFAVLIGPVRYFVLDFVWRFVTDPVSHACWSGLTGYFIGLAVTRRHRWYAVAWIGLAAAAILHGLNDWGRVNGHPLWILVVAVSGILFLGYAKAGSEVARTLPPMPYCRPSGGTGRRTGTRPRRRTALPRLMRCPAARHQGRGGSTRSWTGRTAAVARRNPGTQSVSVPPMSMPT
jgi:hypothetical protein